MFLGELARMFDRAGPFFRRKGRGSRMEAAHQAILLFARHWQQSRIFRLMRSQGKAIVDRRAQSVFVDPICCDAGGASIGSRSNRHHQPLLGNVLVDGVVGKSRQRLDRFINVYFRLRNAALFRQPQHRGANLA